MTQNKKLSPREKQVLSVVELAPQLTAREVASVLGVRTPSVHYVLQTLEERGAIERRAVINFMRLGFMNVMTYFSLKSPAHKPRKELIRLLAQHPQVAWVGSLAGEYHYGFAFLTRDLTALQRELSLLGDRFGGIFGSKIIAPRLSITQLARSFVPQQRRSRRFFRLDGAGPVHPIDSLDHDILKIVANQPVASMRDVARRLGASPSTVERRIEGLLRDEVIAGFCYRIDPAWLGVNAYRLLIETDNVSSALRKEMVDYALSCPEATLLLENLGAWDFEIEIEAAEPARVIEISQELGEIAGAQIARIRMLTEIEDFKLSYYPFDVTPSYFASKSGGR